MSSAKRNAEKVVSDQQAFDEAERYEEFQKEFSDLAMCAVRYALGRATYVSHSIPRAICKNMMLMTSHSLRIIIRDIEEHKQLRGAIGWDIDDQNWELFKTMCEQALKLKEVEEENAKREKAGNRAGDRRDSIGQQQPAALLKGRIP